jgi:UPF0755 protein
LWKNDEGSFTSLTGEKMFQLLKHLLVFTFITAVSVAGVFYFWWTVPPSQDSTSTQVEVLDGANFAQITHALAVKNIIRWPIAFRIYGRIVEADSHIRAGTYEFSAGVLPAQVMEKLLKGVVVLAEFSHPPGFNMYQVEGILRDKFPHISLEAWGNSLTEKSLINVVAPGANSLEGYLFPDVYRIRTKATATEIIRMMIANFKKNLTPEMIAEGKALGLSPHQIVTLASIVEKETGTPSERPLIAAVFFNRLRIGMRLQTDPTVIYGIWDQFDGNLRRSDLETPTPYNTYTNAGLPPGPIANPGREALWAAVRPTKTPFLYFVAKGDGTHYFSSSLSEHNGAVRKYQIAPNQRKTSP